MHRALPSRCRQLAKHSVALRTVSYKGLRETIGVGCGRSFATIYDAKPRPDVMYNRPAEMRRYHAKLFIFSM